MSPEAPDQITRDDIKRKLEELRGGVDEATAGAQRSAAVVGVMVAGVIIVAAYWLGRRRGGRRRSIIEITPV
jgi:hypothetical protein